MRKFKTIAAVALAAGAVGVSGLVTAPTASAAYSCAQLVQTADFYMSLGDIEKNAGNYTQAQVWYARASTIYQVCSG
jgi:hypothetical protein